VRNVTAAYVVLRFLAEVVGWKLDVVRDAILKRHGLLDPAPLALIPRHA